MSHARTPPITFQSTWYPTAERFMDALTSSQTARIHRDLGRQVTRYQRRMSEQYTGHEVEHKGTPQSTGQGPYNAWKCNMGKTWPIT